MRLLPFLIHKTRKIFLMEIFFLRKYGLHSTPHFFAARIITKRRDAVERKKLIRAREGKIASGNRFALRGIGKHVKASGECARYHAVMRI